MILNQPVDQKIILPTNEFVSSSHIYVMQLHFLGFQCKKTLIVQVEPTRPRDNRQHQSQAEQHQSLTLGFSLEIEQQSLCHVGRPRQARMEKKASVCRFSTRNVPSRVDFCTYCTVNGHIFSFHLRVDKLSRFSLVLTHVRT